MLGRMPPQVLGKRLGPALRDVGAAIKALSRCGANTQGGGEDEQRCLHRSRQAHTCA